MEEKNFFNERDVSVTNARFITPGQTYAMSGVTSVKSYHHSPSRVGPIIIGILGCLIMLGGGKAILTGMVLLAGAAIWWLTQKTVFAVKLASASGEAEALTDTNGEFISRVINALNEAIVHRG